MTDEKRTMITFTVYGQPRPAGSKRAFPIRRKDGSLGAVVSDTSGQEGKEWRALVQAAARKEYSGPLLIGPLRLTIIFALPRPQGHFGTGKNGLIVKDSAPKFPTKRPDLLKLARAVEDALSGVVWKDDSQIVWEILRKQYGNRYAMQVEIIEQASEAMEICDDSFAD